MAEEKEEWLDWEGKCKLTSLFRFFSRAALDWSRTHAAKATSGPVMIAPRRSSVGRRDNQLNRMMLPSTSRMVFTLSGRESVEIFLCCAYSF